MVWGHKTAMNMVGSEAATLPLRKWLAALLMSAMLLAGMLMAANSTAWRVSAAGTEDMVSYTVRPGDTLWEYAAQATPEGGDVNDTLDELMRLNHLDSVQLSVGQRIMVPSGDD